MNDQAANRISEVRAELVMRKPFWASLAMKLTPVEDSSRETIATDGDRLAYNPEWVNEMDFEHLLSTVARVAFACALKHHTRREDRDYRIYQRASQLVTHPILKADGFNLPDSAEIDPSLGDLDVETCYDVLKSREQPPTPQGDDSDDESQNDDNETGDDDSSSDGSDSPRSDDRPEDDDDDGSDGESDGSDSDGSDGSDPGDDDSSDSSQGGADGADGADGQDDDETGQGGDSSGQGGSSQQSEDPGETGEIMDSAASSDSERDEDERDWDIALKQATQLAIAQGEGKMPGGLKAQIDEMFAPLAPWEEILLRFKTEIAKDDYRWFPPNRRFVHNDIYLPSRRSERMPEIVIMIDTSGSVFSVTELLKRFLSEVRAVFEDLQPERIHLISVDSGVRDVRTLEQFDEISEYQPVGGGGTDFRPGFRYLEDEQIEPMVCLYFTDLICSSYPEDPGFPVIWAKYGNASPETYGCPVEPPFGELLLLES